MLWKMYDKAKICEANAEISFIDSTSINYVNVYPIQSYGEDIDTVSYFEIEGETNGYIVYQILDRIYYRDSEEFRNILNDFKDEVPGQAIEALKVGYTDDTELESYSVLDQDNCMFVISSIFISLTGDSCDDEDMYNISETAKIRLKNSIDSDNDLNNSKLADEAKYGKKDENDFKQEIEDKQKADGTIGALDQPQEETYKPELPNAHMLQESKNKDIEFEVRDKIIFDDQIWYVIGVNDTLDFGQILTITREGHTLSVPANSVKARMQDLNAIVIDQFDLDDKTRLNKKPENEKPQKMNDYNDQSIFCNVKFDKSIFESTVDGKAFKANLKDILEEADPVRVYIDGTDEEMQIPKADVIICDDEWPYAVVVGEDDEPVRKIRVNPTSYIEAQDDTDLVQVIIGDKHTELPKHAIKILS